MTQRSLDALQSFFEPQNAMLRGMFGRVFW